MKHVQQIIDANVHGARNPLRDNNAGLLEITPFNAPDRLIRRVRTGRQLLYRELQPLPSPLDSLPEYWNFH